MLEKPTSEFNMRALRVVAQVQMLIIILQVHNQKLVMEVIRLLKPFRVHKTHTRPTVWSQNNTRAK